MAKNEFVLVSRPAVFAIEQTPLAYNPADYEYQATAPANFTETKKHLKAAVKAEIVKLKEFSKTIGAMRKF